jgi:WD40 repeat protein
VESVTFSPDDVLLASGSLDNTVKLWEVFSGQELQALSGTEPVTGVAFSPGRLLASVDFEGKVRLWEAVEKQYRLRTVTQNTFRVHSLAFSPDGTLLATGHRDGTVQLWDIVKTA